MVQDWLANQADIEPLAWVPRGCDLNPIENVWAEVVRTMKDRWVQPATRDQLWDAVEAAWLDVTEGPLFVHSLVESMPRRMAKVLEYEGGWTGY